MKQKESFKEKCYAKLKEVPKGKITTYKDLAKAINSKAYRAVGTAMNKNPYAYNHAISQEAIRNRRSVIRGSLKETSGCLLVPCHRVVKSNGEIGKFASGVENKIKLLKKEGIKIKNNKVLDFDKVRYKF